LHIILSIFEENSELDIFSAIKLILDKIKYKASAGICFNEKTVFIKSQTSA